MHNQTGCIAGMGLMPSGIDSLRYRCGGAVNSMNKINEGPSNF